MDSRQVNEICDEELAEDIVCRNASEEEPHCVVLVDEG